MPIETAIGSGPVGLLRTIVGTDPAAGVEISETVPNGVAWRICCLNFQLVTAAVGGSRTVTINLDDGSGGVSYQTGANFEQVANRIDDYTVAPTGVIGPSVMIGVFAGELLSIPFPYIFLPPGSRFFTVTLGMDPLDDYGAPVVLLEEIVHE